MRLLPIAKPCNAPFAAMTGDDKTRFCTECGKHVHDLSARTEDEARALLAAARGTRICVRYAKDARGNVRFRAAAMAAAVSLAACASAAPEAPPATAAAAVESDHDQGDMIPDVEDKCPDQPGDDDDDGCPAAPPASSGAPATSSSAPK
ncbi:MAG: hypothetical protein ACXWUG_30110 [Polyangiales bacterium]